MDTAILKRYDALKAEQRDIKRNVDRLGREASELLNCRVSDTVKGTKADGTYGRITISGIPMPELNAKRAKIQECLKRYEDISQELEDMTYDIDMFIFGIDDSLIRTILRLKYLDGLPWRDVSRHYGKSGQYAFNLCQRYFNSSEGGTGSPSE